MLGFFEPSLPVLLLIFLLLCIGAPSSTDAWGREGHKLICKIAENRLLPEAKAAVRRVLEGRKLEDLCSWADETEAKRKYPQSGPLHYVQIQGDTCDFCYGSNLLLFMH
ncbi:hypothetical protein Taro_017930 [Colocasia esculenta]|uniref:Aspergillus nuclease S1 n=1 Tax=Colocasia esculenta TaxID=4460 RepID=A0A843UXK4_COLES|nr:hypothetical protein [Colocasia esculenta]